MSRRRRKTPRRSSPPPAPPLAASRSRPRTGPMRLFPLAALLIVPGLSLAQEKKDDKVVPIPEVKLARTDPVLYEKDVEPILANKCFVCHSGKEINGKLDLS